jgi:hypothetical protein
MAAIVYIEKENVEHVRIKNDSGADMAQYEFGVVGPFAAVADEAVENNAVGPFHIEQGLLIQTDELTTSEDTFATSGQNVYWNATTRKFSDTLTEGYYLVGNLITIKNSAGIIWFEKRRYASLVPASLVDIQAEVTAAKALAGIPFHKVVSLTAAAAATPVDILTDANVGSGKKAYITHLLVTVGGATAWTDDTATIVTIQDKNGTAVVGATIAKAQLTNAAILGMLSTGVTLGAAIKSGTGFTTAKGLVVVADANFAAGSTLAVTVAGFVK